MNSIKRSISEKVLDTTLGEYNRSLEFKIRIESKAIGYITILTLILSIVITILSIILNEKTSNEFSILKILSIMVSLPVIYFSLLSFCVCLFILRPRKIHYFNSDELEQILFDKTEDVYGTLFLSAKLYIKNNSKVLKEMDFYNDLVYTFIVIDIVCFIFYIFVELFILIPGG